MSYTRLVRPYWDRVSIHEGRDVFLRQFTLLPVPSQHLYATHWVQSEVQNGGLAQFFDNGLGVLAPEAISGFRTLGMSKTADVLAEAVEMRARAKTDKSESGEMPTPVEDRFSELLEGEAGGFWVAADRYAEGFSA